MMRSSKSSRKTTVLERPKGVFSIEDEFLTPTSRSQKLPKPATSSALARVQALTSKLSISTSVLDSDSECLLKESSSSSSRNPSAGDSYGGLTVKSKSLGRLNEETIPALPSPSESYDSVYDGHDASFSSRDSYERRGIRFSKILAPRTTGGPSAQTSQSTSDLRQQGSVSPKTTPYVTQSQYSSAFDLRPSGLSPPELSPVKPTPSPRTSLGPAKAPSAGASGSLYINKNPLKDTLDTRINHPEPLVGVEINPISRPSPTNDYPSEKNPFSSDTLPVTLPRPNSIANTSARRTDSEFDSLSKFRAGLSSNPSKIFEHKPLPSLADPYSNRYRPFSYSSLAPASDSEGERFKSLPSLPKRDNAIHPAPAPYTGWSTLTNDESSVIPSGSALPKPESRVLGRTDLYTSAEKRVFERAKLKSQAPPPPLTTPPQDDKLDCPKLHRAQTDFKYSLLQPESSAAHKTVESSSTYFRSPFDSDKTALDSPSKALRDHKPGAETAPPKVHSSFGLIGFSEQQREPQHKEIPPPLPAVPPPGGSLEESKLKSSVESLDKSFARWRDQLMPPEDPAPLIVLAPDGEENSTTTDIVTSMLKKPSIKKLAPTPSEQRILQTGYKFSEPAQEVLSTYRDRSLSPRSTLDYKKVDAGLPEIDREQSRTPWDTSPQRIRESTNVVLNLRPESLNIGRKFDDALSRRSLPPSSSKSSTLPVPRREPKQEGNVSASNKQQSTESLSEYSTSTSPSLLGSPRRPPANRFATIGVSDSRSLPRLPSSSASRLNPYASLDASNPFALSDDESSTESKLSIFDNRNANSPLQASTPYGTLKKKFGGSGLVQAWCNDLSSSASGIQSQTSLNANGYPEGANPFDDSAESLNSLSTCENQKEAGSYNPFFDEMNGDDEDAEHEEKPPEPPPRRNRTLSRNSVSLTSLNESRRDLLELGNKTRLNSSIGENLDFSQDTLGESDLDQSIDLDLSRPLPPLPKLPDSLSRQICLVSPAREDLKLSDGVGSKAKSDLGRVSEPIDVGKLATSNFRKANKDRRAARVNATTEAHPTEQPDVNTRPASHEIPEDTAPKNDAVEPSNGSWSPIEDTINTREGRKTSKKKRTNPPRSYSKTAKKRPSSKPRSIVIQYIYHTPAPDAASLPNHAIGNDVASSPTTAPLQPLPALAGGPSSSVIPMSNTMGLTDHAAAETTPHSEVPAEDCPKSNHKSEPSPEARPAPETRPGPEPMTPLTSSTDPPKTVLLLPSDSPSSVRPPSAIIGATEPAEKPPKPDLEQTHQENRPQDDALVEPQNSETQKPNAVVEEAQSARERVEHAEVEEATSALEDDSGRIEITSQPPKNSFPIDVSEGGLQNVEASPMVVEDYICESPSTSETSYGSDPDDEDSAISSFDLSARWNNRTLSVIHEYSEEESLEQKFPEIVEHSGARDDGLFFVEAIPEDEDQFQVHSVVHDDLNPLSDTDLDGFENAEETTQNENPGFRPAENLEQSRPNFEANVVVGKTIIEPVQSRDGVPLPTTSIETGTAPEGGSPSDLAAGVNVAKPTDEQPTREVRGGTKNPLDNSQTEHRQSQPTASSAEVADDGNLASSSDPTERVDDDLEERQTAPLPATEAVQEEFRTNLPDNREIEAADEATCPKTFSAGTEMSLDEGNDSIFKKVSKIRERPRTLPLGEQRSQNSSSYSDAISRKECLESELPVNQATQEEAVAFETLFEKVQLSNDQLATPIQIIETPVVTQARSTQLPDEAGAGEGGIEADDEGPALPPRTLPLPPIDLISRRYSEGDANLRDKSSLHRKMPRRNSVSPAMKTKFEEVDLDQPQLSPRKEEALRTPTESPTEARRTPKPINRPVIAPPKPPPKAAKAIEAKLSPALPPPPPPNREPKSPRTSSVMDSPAQPQRVKSLSERFAEAQATQNVALPPLSAQERRDPPLPTPPLQPTLSPGKSSTGVPQRRPAPPIPVRRNQGHDDQASVNRRSSIANVRFQPLPSLSDVSIKPRTEAEKSSVGRIVPQSATMNHEHIDSIKNEEHLEPPALGKEGNHFPEVGDTLVETTENPQPTSGSGRRPSHSAQAERIFGRTMSFSEEDNKLLIQLRLIEEQQASLSAEARLVERQLYEATKETALKNDLPRLDLDQETGKYKVSNEISLELLPETLVADLYRILNVKNQLAGKHKQIKFLQLYNELQREQVEIETKLRNLGKSNDGSQADADFEKALINKLMEIVEQRDKLVETMDEDRKRKKSLGELSQSSDDVSNDSMASSVSIRSSKSLTAPNESSSQSAMKARKKKRKGVRHFIKKRYKRVFHS